MYRSYDSKKMIPQVKKGGTTALYDFIVSTEVYNESARRTVKNFRNLYFNKAY